MSFNGWSWRAFVRPIGLLSIGAVVAAGLVTTAVAAKPPTAPKSAKTEAEASRLAAQFNTSVEVADKLTEYTRTVATPQGTLQAELSNQPVRVRRGGSWVDIDTSLEVRPDGFIAPKASTADVAFSNGGAGPLARFKQDGSIFELNSPWGLPKPTLSGSKATYASVLPGVDLVINATTDTFSYNLVVQTREAASNPLLKTLTFPVTTQNLELRTTQPGRPSYIDASGKQVLSIGEAMMWDSAGAKTKTDFKTGAGSAKAVDEGPAGEAKHALMQFDGSTAGLTVKPDQSMLTAADTVFPVVLDPTMDLTKDRVGWTAAWELYPSTSFWKTEHSLGVGYEGWEQSKIVRSYYQFNTSYYTNKKIIAASLKNYEIHSASCAEKEVIVSRVKPISPRTTWNNQPAVEADVAKKSFANGWSSSCPAGSIEFDVTGSIQASADQDAVSTTFRLRAADESDRIAWKQFNTVGQLHVEYVAYPLPGYELGAATRSDLPDPCSSATDPTVIATEFPQIFAKGKVGVGDTSARVYVDFLIIDQSQETWTMRSPLVSPGVLQKVLPATKMSKSALFTYKARTIRPMPSGPALVSAWSAPCYFKVDMTPPPPPTITARYKGVIVATCDTTPDKCPAVVPYGEKVDYTISSNSTDTVAISYGFNGALVKKTGRLFNVSFVPPSRSTMELQAKTHDSAARTSTLVYHRLGIGPELPPVAVWNLDETSGGIAKDDSGNNHPLTVTDAEWDDNGRVDGSLISNGTSSRATAAASAVDTSQNFSISAWVRLTSLSDSGVVTITGQSANGGQLRYWRTANRWTFVQTVSDDPGVAQDRVSSLGPPVLNAWTHLLGVFDASKKKMLLYVNGRLQGTADLTHTPWKATRAVEVGSYRVGTGIGVFPGSLDTVKIYQRVVEEPEARELADPRAAGAATDEPVAGLTASYSFDTMVSGPDGLMSTPDAVYGAGLTLAGFPGANQSEAIVEDDDRGKVLAMSGNAAESATINRPLVDTSASFTVTVWAKLSDISQPRVLARQAGATNDAWRLEYRPQAGSDNVDWVFTLANGDTASATTSPATENMGSYQADRWVALVAQYDASKAKMTMKFGDRSKNGVTESAVPPFTTGMTRFGGSPRSGPALPMAGYIDDLRVYAGVVGQKQLCNDLGVETGCL